MLLRSMSLCEQGSQWISPGLDMNSGQLTQMTDSDTCLPVEIIVDLANNRTA